MTVTVNGAAAAQWAAMRVRLHEIGRRINVNYLWIAAVAAANDLPILTQDAEPRMPTSTRLRRPADRPSSGCEDRVFLRWPSGTPADQSRVTSTFTSSPPEEAAKASATRSSRNRLVIRSAARTSPARMISIEVA